jgi:hypothetical protein
VHEQVVVDRAFEIVDAVGASPPPTLSRQRRIGNPMSGAEH